jgi:arylformamidase
MPEPAPELIDISPRLAPDLAVFPGDTPLSRELLLELERGDPVTLSTLRSTVHLGAHVDAPSHYGAGAASIDALPLERFVGPCRVIRIPAEAGALVSWTAVHEALGGREATPRLLLATGTYPDATTFDRNFAGIEPGVARELCRQGVELLGVDTPSVDPADSEELPAHAACLESGITILEGLVLDGVAEGAYELIALPLRLAGFEASPVRAILRRI